MGPVAQALGAGQDGEPHLFDLVGLGYLHEKLGTQICAYGAMCLYVSARSRWSGRRLRVFGPGMSIEPEFYEELGHWFYRAGVVACALRGSGLFGTRRARH